MKIDNKPSILKAVLFSLLALVIFYLVSEVLGLILSLIFAVMLMIPIIGNLAELLFKARGDDPASAILYFYLVAAYFITISILERIVKSIPTRKLATKLLGIYLIALNITFFILNLLGDGAAWVNVGFIIAGIAFIVKSAKYVAPPAPTTNPQVSSSVADEKEETFYYMEAANGMTVRVPESRLETWQAEQNRIRENPESRKLTEKEQLLVEMIVQGIYGPKDE